MSRDRLATSLPQLGQDSHNKAHVLAGLEGPYFTPPRLCIPHHY